jgi:hypothetical protein
MVCSLFICEWFKQERRRAMTKSQFTKRKAERLLPLTVTNGNVSDTYDGREGEEEEDGINMGEEHLSLWCDRYSNVESMKKYIMVDCLEPRRQERFVDTLSVAAIMKDNVNELRNQYGHIYRWVLRFERPLSVGDTPCSGDRAGFVSRLVETHFRDYTTTSSKCPLPTGWRWVLQLRTNEQKWVDWIYIQKSNRTAATLGAFSARDFPKGSTIGYYCGEVRWVSDTALIAKPTGHHKDGDHAGAGTATDREGVIVRNACAKWQLIVANKLEGTDDNQQPLYLGMHYINTACLGFEKNSREYNRAQKDQNCLLLQDGRVITLKKIPPHFELLRPFDDRDGFSCHEY